MTGRLAAVTGATGFLGRQVVRALAADGWRVRVLARKDPVHALWRGFEPEVVAGDLADPEALERLCAGADVVIHSAALTKARSRTAFEAVNVAGAARLAEAAGEAAQVVLVSSLAAREPQLSDYAASKRAAEQALAARLGRRLTVVRPPALYGPEDRELAPMFRAAAEWPALPVLAPSARVTLLHVADAAAQIAALAARPPGGATYALSDACPGGYSWREIMVALSASVGTAPRLLRIPEVALSAAAGAVMLAAQAFGATPMLTFGKAREILHRDWSIAPGEQAADLPAARFDLSTGLANTAAWSISQGWLRPAAASNLKSTDIDV